MYRRKVYGQSREEECHFCGKTATTTNKDGLGTCTTHKSNPTPVFKCVCGEYLDLKRGKWGPYFNCFKCGNISFAKGLDMQP